MQEATENLRAVRRRGFRRLRRYPERDRPSSHRRRPPILLPVADRHAGSRFQFTVGVDSLDAVCDELSRRGVTLLNGQMDRPWGIRTAGFLDPGGHIWEVAQDLS